METHTEASPVPLGSPFRFSIYPHLCPPFQNEVTTAHLEAGDFSGQSYLRVGEPAGPVLLWEFF